MEFKWKTEIKNAELRLKVNIVKSKKKGTTNRTTELEKRLVRLQKQNGKT